MIQRFFFSIKAPPPQNETIFEKSVVLIVQALFRTRITLKLVSSFNLLPWSLTEPCASETK